MEDETEGVIFNLSNVYYLPDSPSNLISLAELNDNNIFYDNKRQTLYQKVTKKILASAERWRKSFILKLLSPSVAAVRLTKVSKDTYQAPRVHQK